MNGYNLEKLENKPKTDGKYLYISPLKKCVNEIRVDELEKKMFDLENKIQIMEEREISNEYDNILCDYISEVYEVIATKIRKNIKSI